MAKSLLKTARDTVMGVPWSNLTKALDAGDLAAAKRFMADEEIPLGLLPVLQKIRPEAERLRAIVAAGADCENPERLEEKVKLLEASRPTSVKNADEIVDAIHDCRQRKNDAARLRGAAEIAQGNLQSLEGFFPELFGIPHVRIPHTLAGFPPEIQNQLVAAGFNISLLLNGPWYEVFRRPSAEPKRRIRLVAR